MTTATLLRSRRSGVRGSVGGWLILLAPSLLVVLGVFIVPLAIMLRFSFDSYTFGEGQQSAFVLDNYVRFFSDPFYLGILGRTILIGLLVTVLSLVLSLPLAYAMARSGPTWTRILTLIVVIPLLTNVVVRSFGWMILLGHGGIVQVLLSAFGVPDARWMFTPQGIVISLVEVLMPFMVLTIAGVMQHIDPQLELAVRSLGGGSWRVFRDVVLPLSVPGMAAGSLLVFVLSISAFATPALIGGSQTPVMASMIFDQAMIALNWPFASAMSMVVLVMVLLLVLAQGSLLRRANRTTSRSADDE